MSTLSILRTASLKSLFAALLYGFISISITFFNKAVLSKFDFEYPNFMSLAQMICSIILLESMRVTGQIQYPALSYQHAYHTLPLALSFVGMVLTGLAALMYLNIPMYNSLRRLTTLLTMLGEYYALGLTESRSIYYSVVLMVGGAMVAGYTDLNYNSMGYFLVLLNCIFTAVYLLFIAKFGKMGLNSFGLMYYNNILSLPVVVAICYYTNDFHNVWYNYPHLFEPSFIICFLFQSVLAFLLNYSIFLCTNVNSALTTSVTGQIKNIATTAVGFFTFSNNDKYDMYNVFGIILGVYASGYYSYIKYRESELKSHKSILPSTNDKLIDLTQQHDDDTELNKGHKPSLLHDITNSINNTNIETNPYINNTPTQQSRQYQYQPLQLNTINNQSAQTRRAQTGSESTQQQYIPYTPPAQMYTPPSKMN